MQGLTVEQLDGYMRESTAAISTTATTTSPTGRTIRSRGLACDMLSIDRRHAHRIDVVRAGEFR